MDCSRKVARRLSRVPVAGFRRMLENRLPGATVWPRSAELQKQESLPRLTAPQPATLTASSSAPRVLPLWSRLVSTTARKTPRKVPIRAKPPTE